MTLGVGAGQARSSADAHRRRAAARDPLFAPWLEATVGDPVVVHTIEGTPAYWLVPVERGGRVIGFVRVAGEGDVTAAGVFYRRPDELSRCPGVVTGITRSEAEEAAIAVAGVSTLDQPPSSLYVHDGPPGREAWLVVVGGHRFLVTPGGVREAPGGST